MGQLRHTQATPTAPTAPGTLGTNVDHPGRVTVLEVVQHGRLVQVRQHGHVLDPVELGGVHRIHILWFDHQGLSEKTDGDHLVSSVGLAPRVHFLVCLLQEA